MPNLITLSNSLQFILHIIILTYSLWLNWIFTPHLSKRKYFKFLLAYFFFFFFFCHSKMRIKNLASFGFWVYVKKSLWTVESICTFPSCHLVLSKHQIICPTFPSLAERGLNTCSRGVFMAQAITQSFPFLSSSMWSANDYYARQYWCHGFKNTYDQLQGQSPLTHILFYSQSSSWPAIPLTWYMTRVKM